MADHLCGRALAGGDTVKEQARALTLAVSFKTRVIVWMIAAAAMLLAILVVGVAMLAVLTSSSSAGACGTGQQSVIPVADGEGADEQVKNAQLIDKAAASLGLSGQASRIAIITAMGESSLINIDYDDNARNPDGSIANGGGLFQQQPSQGWGTWEQVMDPTYAATSFLTGPGHDRKRGLVSIAGWETMEPTLAIHKVQINSDPNHYARFYAEADAIIARAGIDVNRAGDGSASEAATAGCAPAGPIGEAAYPLDQPFNMTSGFGPRNISIPGASKWHPALDFQNWPNPCGKPVYAVLPGEVVLSDRLWLSIRSQDGFVISYLHMYKSERIVNVGETVATGQQIGVVGNEGPSGGCHLDIRINVSENTNPHVAALTRGDASAGAGNYVNPLDFFPLFGLDPCPIWCTKNF